MRLGEKGGVAGLNFYPHFVRENGKQVTIRTLCEHTLHMIRKGGEDLPAIGSDLDGYEIEEPKNEAYISHVGGNGTLMGGHEAMWDHRAAVG